jgi:hypothetical protein
VAPRLTNIAGIAALLCLAAPVGLRAQSPPITIPPAQVKPPAAPAVQIAPVASSLLPSDVQVMHDSQGAGIVMYGALNGKAESALGVLRGVFAYSQAFDPSPALRLVLADEGDRHAQALFVATAHGTPITGIAAVALSDASGDVSVFYDDAAAFPASFARMRQAFAQNNGNAVLAPLQLADGNGIGIPPGWLMTGQGAGAVVLRGPLGEMISLGAALPIYGGDAGSAGDTLQAPCCDPGKVLQAVFPQLAALDQRLGRPATQLADIIATQPAANPNSAFILANASLGERPYVYFGLVEAVAGFTDPWTLHLSWVLAPQALFTAEFPILLQVWRSYSANPPGFAERLRQAAEGIAATQPLVAATTAAHQTADYNASAGWDEVVRKSGGGQARIDNALEQQFADWLSSDTGRPWRVIPLSTLR